MKVSEQDKIFTFVRNGLGYSIKIAKASANGETFKTIFGLRKMFDEYEKEGYKYVNPTDYEWMKDKLFDIHRSEE